MPPDPPKLVFPLAFEGLIMGFLLIASGLGFAALGNFVGLLSAFGALILILMKIRTVSTRVTEAGVSQLTLRGRVHLSWNEVSEVKRAPLSFTLVGGRKRVVVSVEEYADSAAAMSYMEAQLPASLRSR